MAYNSIEFYRIHPPGPKAGRFLRQPMPRSTPIRHAFCPVRLKPLACLVAVLGALPPGAGAVDAGPAPDQDVRAIPMLPARVSYQLTMADDDNQPAAAEVAKPEPASVSPVAPARSAPALAAVAPAFVTEPPDAPVSVAASAPQAAKAPPEQTAAVPAVEAPVPQPFRTEDPEAPVVMPAPPVVRASSAQPVVPYTDEARVELVSGSQPFRTEAPEAPVVTAAPARPPASLEVAVPQSAAPFRTEGPDLGDAQNATAPFAPVVQMAASATMAPAAEGAGSAALPAPSAPVQPAPQPAPLPATPAPLAVAQAATPAAPVAAPVAVPDTDSANPVPPGDRLALKPEPQLAPDRVVEEQIPVFVQGEKISGQTGVATTVEGDAELRKRGSQIKAETITYWPPEDEVLAKKDVRALKNGDLFTGSELRLKLDAQTGYFLNVHYLLAGEKARGEARRMDFLGQDSYRAENATYTTCGPGNDDWYLKVGELQLDYGRDVGEAQNAQLYF